MRPELVSFMATDGLAADRIIIALVAVENARDATTPLGPNGPARARALMDWVEAIASRSGTGDQEDRRVME